MARKPAAKKDKAEAPRPRTDFDESYLARHVDRRYKLMRQLQDAKDEYKDSKEDDDAEIKANFERTGVDAKRVDRLAKIRLDEDKARVKMNELSDDLDVWDRIREFDKSLEDDDDEV